MKSVCFLDLFEPSVQYVNQKHAFKGVPVACWLIISLNNHLFFKYSQEPLLHVSRLSLCPSFTVVSLLLIYKNIIEIMAKESLKLLALDWKAFNS